MLSPFAKGFVLFFFFEFYHHTASSEGSEREEVWFKLVIIQKGSKDLSSHVNSYETMEFFNETMDSIIRNHWWTNHSVISMIHFGTRTWSEVSTNFRLIYGKWMESRRDSYVLMVNLRAWRVYIVDHTRGNNLRRGGWGAVTMRRLAWTMQGAIMSIPSNRDSLQSLSSLQIEAWFT